MGSKEFFERIRPYMDCYRFPYIMARIEREAAVLEGKHLLEIGCGLGFDAVAFMRRGVRVTATDLTPLNVELAKRHCALEGVTPAGGGCGLHLGRWWRAVQRPCWCRVGLKALCQHHR